MDGFKVMLKQMYGQSEQITDYRDRLEAICEDVRDIRRNLRHKISSMDDIGVTLDKLDDRIQEEAKQMLTMGNVLRNSADQYQNTEKRITGQMDTGALNLRWIEDMQSAFQDFISGTDPKNFGSREGGSAKLEDLNFKSEPRFGGYVVGFNGETYPPGYEEAARKRSSERDLGFYDPFNNPSDRMPTPPPQTSKKSDQGFTIMGYVLDAIGWDESIAEIRQWVNNLPWYLGLIKAPLSALLGNSDYIEESARNFERDMYTVGYDQAVDNLTEGMVEKGLSIAKYTIKSELLGEFWNMIHDAVKSIFEKA